MVALGTAARLLGALRHELPARAADERGAACERHLVRALPAGRDRALALPVEDQPSHPDAGFALRMLHGARLHSAEHRARGHLGGDRLLPRRAHRGVEPAARSRRRQETQRLRPGAADVDSRVAGAVGRGAARAGGRGWPWQPRLGRLLVGAASRGLRHLLLHHGEDDGARPLAGTAHHGSAVRGRRPHHRGLGAGGRPRGRRLDARRDQEGGVYTARAAARPQHAHGRRRRRVDWPRDHGGQPARGDDSPRQALLVRGVGAALDRAALGRAVCRRPARRGARLERRRRRRADRRRVPGQLGVAAAGPRETRHR
mmetsp:Transcript_37890/g.89124  ORF Transcript_37890/g.89124 Transcript_37890/m.89124 type:complete len:314 (-) Transcript_37890:226-1167(-)